MVMQDIYGIKKYERFGNKTYKAVGKSRNKQEALKEAKLRRKTQKHARVKKTKEFYVVYVY